MTLKNKIFLLIISALISYSGIVNAQAPNWLWAKSSGGLLGDIATYVTTLSTGDVVLTGSFESPVINFDSIQLSNTSGVDIFIVKYDPIGNIHWVKTISGGGYSTGITSDSLGAVIVSGYFFNSTITFDTITLLNANGGNPDVFVVKYDSTGNAIWARSFGGLSWERANAITSDKSGNIYVAGYFEDSSIVFDSFTITNTFSDTGDIFLTKFNSSGNVIWAKGAGGISGDFPNAIVYDSVANSIYLAGEFYSPTIVFDSNALTNSFQGSTTIFLTKYDTSGNAIWCRGASSNSVGGSAAVAVSTDTYGNIYIAGNFSSSIFTLGTSVLSPVGNSDIFIAKYDSFGNVDWARGSGGIRSEGAFSLSTNPLNGDIFMTGGFGSASITFGFLTLINSNVNYNDMFLARYNSVGDAIWATSIGGIAHDGGLCVASSTTGELYVVGYFRSPFITFGLDTLTNNGGEDLFIAKLDSATITGIKHLDRLDRNFMMYPNPTKEFLVISSLLSGNIKAEVTISDISGNLIYSTTLRESQMIEVNTKDFAEGIYIVQIQTADLIETKKLIVVK